jgi:hypothetical protein
MPNKFTWGEDQFNTKIQTEIAIAKSIVEDLENTGYESVSSQTGRIYNIVVSVKLVPAGK